MLVVGQRRIEVDPDVTGEGAVAAADQHVLPPVVASVAVHGDRHVDVLEERSELLGVGRVNQG